MTTMRAAGLRETKSWALRLPALVAIVACSALFAEALSADPHTPLYGGAARGHREGMPPLFQSMFLTFGAGAALGGLLSRVRLHTLVLFNAASAFVAALVLSLVYMLRAHGTEGSLSSWAAAAIFFLVFNWAFPFAIFQIAAALVGRLAQRLVAAVMRQRWGRTPAQPQE